MVNRKSRNASFLTTGSPKKRMLNEIVKEKVVNPHPKEQKGKKRKGIAIKWDDAKEYFENLDKKKKKR